MSPFECKKRKCAFLGLDELCYMDDDDIETECPLDKNERDIMDKIKDDIQAEANGW